MQFILIYKTGRVLTFSVKACAEVFQKAYGGTLIVRDLSVVESVTA